MILLFPDGKLTARRWRRPLWVYAVLVGYVTATTAGLDSVHSDLAAVVTTALEPAHLTVWMSERRWNDPSDYLSLVRSRTESGCPAATGVP